MHQITHHGRSRHINIRHFFVKDRIDKGELTVEHCPTELMIADYLTKPLQGKQFQLFRILIMGWKNIDDILHEIRSAAKERVENNKKVTANANQRKTYKDALMRTSEKYRMKIGEKIRRNE